MDNDLLQLITWGIGLIGVIFIPAAIISLLYPDEKETFRSSGGKGY